MVACPGIAVFAGVGESVADFAKGLVEQGILTEADAREQVKAWAEGAANPRLNYGMQREPMVWMTEEQVAANRKERLVADLTHYAETGTLPEGSEKIWREGAGMALAHFLHRAKEEDPAAILPQNVFEKVVERAAGEPGFPVLEAAEHLLRTGQVSSAVEAALGSVTDLLKAGGALGRILDSPTAVGRIRALWESRPGTSERVAEDVLATLDRKIRDGNLVDPYHLVGILVAARGYDGRASAMAIQWVAKEERPDHLLYDRFVRPAARAFKLAGENPAQAFTPGVRKILLDNMALDRYSTAPAFRYLATIREPWPELEAEMARRLGEGKGGDAIVLATKYVHCLAHVGVKPPLWDSHSIDKSLNAMPVRTKEDVAQRVFVAQLADAFLGTRLADGLMDTLLAGDARKIPNRFKAYADAVALRAAMAGQRLPSLESAGHECAKTAFAYLSGLPVELVPEAAKAILDLGPLTPPAWGKRNGELLRDFADGKWLHGFHDQINTLDDMTFAVPMFLRLGAEWEAARTPEARAAVAKRAVPSLNGGYLGWTEGMADNFQNLLAKRDPDFLLAVLEQGGCRKHYFRLQDVPGLVRLPEVLATSSVQVMDCPKFRSLPKTLEHAEGFTAKAIVTGCQNWDGVLPEGADDGQLTTDLLPMGGLADGSKTYSFREWNALRSPVGT
jgi:hypothetical protein